MIEQLINIQWPGALVLITIVLAVAYCIGKVCDMLGGL